MTDIMHLSPYNVCARKRRNIDGDEYDNNYIDSDNYLSNFLSRQKRARYNNLPSSPPNENIPSLKRIRSCEKESGDSIYASPGYDSEYLVEEKVIAADEDHTKTDIVELKVRLDNAESNYDLEKDKCKILRRAVAIQDAKIKELSSQNEQLQDVLCRAAAAINGLERANENLKEQLYGNMAPANSIGGGFFPPPPPDVF